MPRYVVERELGELSDDELRAAADESHQVREQGFPEIGWEHSHVVRVNGGLRAICIYSAPDAEALGAYSRRAGLPVDLIHEIYVDIVPETS